MAYNSYPSRTNLPEEVTHKFKLLGGNGAALTMQEGAAGVTCARTGEGVYTLTWAENPGNLACASYCFMAASPDALKAYTMVLDTISSSFVLPFTVYASGTAADLLVDEYLLLTVTFRRGGVR